MELQPCDWHERDVKKKYVVDVYGRLASGETALVRVTGFRPFFYVGGSASVAGGVRVSKYDVMSGFTGKGKIVVWKVMCESLSEFHEKSRALADEGRTLYESNLPPFLRLRGVKLEAHQPRTRHVEPVDVNDILGLGALMAKDGDDLTVQTEIQSCMGM